MLVYVSTNLDKFDDFYVDKILTVSCIDSTTIVKNNLL